MTLEQQQNPIWSGQLDCEKMMMEPRRVEAVYTKVHEGARNAVEQREQVRS
jgi:hypothetical protein